MKPKGKHNQAIDEWCVYCGIRLQNCFGHIQKHNKFTKDHVLPKCLGFKHVVPCCAKCNRLKGRQLPDQWLKSAKLAQRRAEVIANYASITPWGKQEWRAYVIEEIERIKSRQSIQSQNAIKEISR